MASTSFHSNQQNSNNNNARQTSLDRYKRFPYDSKQLKQAIYVNQSSNNFDCSQPQFKFTSNNFDQLQMQCNQQSCLQNQHFNASHSTNENNNAVTLDEAAMDLLRLSTEPAIAAYNNRQKQIFIPNGADCLSKSASTTAVSRNFQTKVIKFL